MQERAGSCERIPTKDVDPGAFSYSKRTEKISPSNYVKKHTGFGGSMVTFFIIIEIKFLSKSAFFYINFFRS